jgi:alkanesulfonate monooxygenase SsuD/methylene tetrahydromethanopterin reductase-like flavin-dependent oxidoreductase (luciferase family)
MRFGLFCTYENPRGDYAGAYADQTELVTLSETLGFDEAWIAEHHFNPNAASPAPLAIIANLAARTSRIRLGSAAVLLPFCDPLLIAEQVATIDILSGGRFNFGVAKGGPFPHQFKHFRLTPEEARARAGEALVYIEKLLYEQSVTFDGRYFSAADLAMAPKPLQAPIPTFVATTTPETLALAAQRGHGFMAGPPFPITQARRTLDLYAQTRATAQSPLILMRFVHLAETRERALAEARVHLQPYVERMRSGTAALQPDWTPWMEMERIIEDSLIGAEADILRQVERIRAEALPATLALKPISPHLEERKQALRFFGEAIVAKA